MKRKLGKLFTVFVTILLLNNTIVKADLNVSKTAAATSVEDVYKINFSIPAETQTPAPIDVVFVMDRTTTNNTFLAAKNAILQLKDLSNVVVNVAVFQFGHNVTDMLSGFVELSDANLAAINAALTQGNQFSNEAVGSNVYGGILLGKNLLETRATPRENQHIILSTDFANNRFDAGNGIGLSQFYSNNTGLGNPSCLASCYPDHVINSDFDAKYRSSYIANPTTFHSLSKLDRLIHDRILFNDSPISNNAQPYFDNISQSIGLYSVPTEVIGGSRRVLTPQELVGTMPFGIRTSVDTPTQLEKFFYHSYNMLEELNDSGVHITALTESYNLGTQNWQQNIMKPVNLYQDYLVEEGILRRYQVDVSTQLQGFTQDIVNDISYAMAKGKLVDVIAPQFEYILNSQILTLNGNMLVKQDIGTQHFGYNIDSNRIGSPYDFEYKYEEILGEETITTFINIPLGVDDLLNISFDERLIEYPSVSGTTTLDTNTRAQLDFISSKDLNLGITELNKLKVIPSPTVDVQMGDVWVHFKDEANNTIKPSEYYLYKVGKQYSFVIPPINGYNYERLGVGSSPITDVTTLQTKEVTLVYSVPKQLEDKVIVHFESNGGSLVNSQTIKKGELAIKPSDPLKIGYKFQGWYLDTQLVNIYDFSRLVNEDITLYAKWEKEEVIDLPATGVQSVLPTVATFILLGLTLILIRNHTKK